MGITVDSLSIDPQNITPARVVLTITYSGFVDTAADNPVKMTASLENGTQVYIAENTTDEKKTLTCAVDDFPLSTSKTMTKTLYVGIDPPDSGKTCTINIHFQPSSGGTGDDEQTHFNL